MKFDIYEYVNLKFEEFLEDENNEKVFLSGEFGMGKTTFINQFFEEKRDVFNVVKLYPVNYAVSPNKDIFRYIKFDILTQLIVNYNIEFKSFNLTELDYLPFYLRQNLYKLFAPLLVWKGGSFGLKIYQQFEKELSEFINDYKKEISEGDDQVVSAFGENLLDEEGSIYEKNVFTEIIIKSLSKVKEKKPNSNNVLIIDDLDRLDPNHIFRLLNVFAAHVDYPNEYKKIYGTNKFNFDKIILIGDLKNIRSIFSHFYGKETDFEGYFDKFYSSYVYHLDISSNLVGILEKIVDNYNYEFKETLGANQHLADRYKRLKKDYLIPILQSLVKSKTITIRSLIKSYDQKIVLNQHSFNSTYNLNFIDAFDFDIFICVSFLSAIFGDFDSLIKSLKATTNQFKGLTININNEMVSVPLAIIVSDQHKFETKNHNQIFEEEVEISDGLKINIKFKYENLFPKYGYQLISNIKNEATVPIEQPKTLVKADPIFLLYQACLKLKKLKFRI